MKSSFPRRVGAIQHIEAVLAVLGLALVLQVAFKVVELPKMSSDRAALAAGSTASVLDMDDKVRLSRIGQ